MSFWSPENYKEHFSDKVVLITGGLGGIGLATARKFKEYGAQVVVTDNRTPEEANAPSDLESICRFIRADGTNQQEVEAVVAQVIQQYGKIDVLFNNMGVGANEPDRVMQKADETKQEDVEYVFQVNLFSHMNFTKAVLPHMRREGSGSIIFSSSTWASGDREGSAAYSSAKAALNKYAETVHYENQQNEKWKNIRVNAIEWPAVDTPLGRGAKAGLPDPLSTAEAADIVLAVAAGKVGNGELVRPSLERDETGKPIVTTKEEEERKKQDEEKGKKADARAVSFLSNQIGAGTIV